MTIKDLRQAEQELMAFVPASPRLTSKDTILDRILPLMELLGNPQDRLKVVHIAGTSGKTSTAYYMAALLGGTGQKVGLTVSPHVDSITERIQINGKAISEELFCAELGEFLEIVRQAAHQPSYFELVYAFTMWVLARQGVDYAVVETGVGGLHDATNVVSRTDKVCAITDIGFDHTHLLGNSLPLIAAQKVGIVHDGNHIFMYRQADEIMAVIERWTKQHHAPLHIVKPLKTDASKSMPDYQQRNWQLARTIYSYLLERDHLKSLTRQVLEATQHVQVPGRMDVREANNKTVVMDGAHNIQKMKAFVDSFHRLYPGAKPAVLLALKEGKEYEELVPLLAPLAGRIIVTTFKTSQDLPVKSMKPELLAEALKKGGAAQVESLPDQKDAFQALMAAPEKICVITGSFYLLGQIRNNEHLA